ncbi:Yip1 member 6 [Clydaea vesicula]|uniref:Yip1 member 6 n=1 Tax=Clydaea vesicula TaxID=447962 RepID=A0AAD5XSK2_9FUNG|nr:Yip1 member 6 [Clydaea vesicula]
MSGNYGSALGDPNHNNVSVDQIFETTENSDLSTVSIMIPTHPEVSGSINSNQNKTKIERNHNLDTLDEPVSQTLLRDLKSIWEKLKQVLLPHKKENSLKDWDLWGPLLLCLALSIRLSITAKLDAANVFQTVFVLIWAGSIVVTLNSKLLGGQL